MLSLGKTQAFAGVCRHDWPLDAGGVAETIYLGALCQL